jgi:hypothetical protein
MQPGYLNVTRIVGNGYSPSELLMGRRLQSTLPIVSDELKPRQVNNELLRQRERDYKQRQKLNYDRRHRATNLENTERISTVLWSVIRYANLWNSVSRKY